MESGTRRWAQASVGALSTASYTTLTWVTNDHSSFFDMPSRLTTFRGTGGFDHSTSQFLLARYFVMAPYTSSIVNSF